MTDKEFDYCEEMEKRKHDDKLKELREVQLLSQHILDLQKDKGKLTDRVKELTKWLSEMSDEKLKLQMLRADLVSKIGNQEKQIAELEAQIEKMKCLLNEIYSEYGFSELVKIRNNLPLEIEEVIKEIKEK